MTAAPCSTQTIAFANPPRPWPRRLLDRVLAANALHKQHQALLRMDDHLLSDIGITRSQAVRHAAKPVWNAPSHWKS